MGHRGGSARMGFGAAVGSCIDSQAGQVGGGMKGAVGVGWWLARNASLPPGQS